MAGRRVRTLIVDDDEDMQLLIRSTIELANHGLEVAGVAGGVVDGAARFWELRPDVLVVDYRMPDGTGVELLRRLRSADATPDVIFCSAHLTDDVRQTMEDLGARAVLQKDDFQSIAQAIRDCAGV